MTKAELVAEIANKTGVDRATTQIVVETFMTSVKNSLLKKENVYLRGFGSYILKERAKKTGRNISKNTTIVIPAHKVPAFKPAKSFSSTIKAKLK
jgi:DNA-binding protein HU-beta